jgi:phage baseplate assembly protein W
MIKSNKDLNLDFTKHPLTGDLVVATGIEAIKKSLRNLILTNVYDVPFNPSIGTSLNKSLFENFTPLTTEFLKSKIKETIEKHEPRVLLDKTTIFQREDYNTLEVSIFFKIISLNKQENISIFVERTR